MAEALKIVLATPEFFPLAKTGGLADVAGALSKALCGMGQDVTVFLPNYRQIRDKDTLKSLSVEPVRIRIGAKEVEAGLKETHLAGNKSRILLIDCPAYYDRPELYKDPKTGTDYTDNDERFILYCRAVLEFLKRLDISPDVIHCNEWQSAPVCAYLKTLYAHDFFFAKTGTLFSIHNLAYQGSFPKESFAKLGLPQELFYPMSPFEYYGKGNFLKSGIHYSDIINTVSETYAKEIQTAEYGCGLEGVLKSRSSDLYGIVNGVDYSEWSPEQDKLIPAKYDQNSLPKKRKNKQALFAECGFPSNQLNWPALGMIGRLVDQKGVDLLVEIVPALLKKELVLVILGSGEIRYEKKLKELAKKYPDQVHVFITFDERLAHLIEAGCDIFLMPSKYEPCGLNQLYSLKYGTVPVVRKTGGLADTIQDSGSGGNGTGFSFREYSSKELLQAIGRALEAYKDRKKWEMIQKNGMNQDFSWDKAAKRYIELYQMAKSKRGALVSPGAF
jgi:starch synthase